jgi:DNA-directed RNA polymerase specialized sigma24 family protein
VSAPRDPSIHTLDWDELRAAIRRRLAYHLQGWPAEEVEDATHDVVLKVLLFVERSGLPANLEGLLTVIARRTASLRIRARTRRPPHDPVREDSSVAPDDALRRELALLDEEVRWRALQVMAFYRESQAPCLELAEARANGVDFKRLATETGQSHRALLQRWSRCMRRLRDAISRGELQWDRIQEGA